MSGIDYVHVEAAGSKVLQPDVLRVQLEQGGGGGGRSKRPPRGLRISKADLILRQLSHG